MVSLPSPGSRLGLGIGLLPVALPVLLPVNVDAPSPLHARAAEPQLRVLLQQGRSVELAAGPVPLQVEDDRGKVLFALAAGQTLRLRSAPSGLQAELRGAGASGRRMVLPLDQIWIDPVPGRSAQAHFLLQRRAFRGRLRVREEGGSLQAINHIGVESYLPSVVGSEMPASWPQEALRAQAVAARTYALRKIRPSAPFDLKATVASQVYKGLEAETASTRQAVASTRSQVLMHGNGLIDAVFHSSSGGLTENSGEIWSRQLPYLVSVPDFDNQSPVHRWEKRFDAGELRRAFPETGGISRIDVLATSSTGRIRRARVQGPRGGLVVDGGELRKRLGLRSTWASFSFQGSAATSGSGGGGRPAPRPIPLAVVRPGERLPASAGSGSRPIPRTALSDLLDAVAGGGAARSSASPQASPLLRGMFGSRSAAPSLVVRGRGFGHGVGMSQWGAHAMARRGQDYEQILRHFYRGAQLRPYRPR